MTTKYNIRIGDNLSIPIDRTMCGITVLDSLIIYAGQTQPTLLSIKQRINGAEQVAVDDKSNLVLCPTYKFSFTRHGPNFELTLGQIRQWHALTKIMRKLDVTSSSLQYNLSEIDSFLLQERAVPVIMQGNVRDIV